MSATPTALAPGQEIHVTTADYLDLYLVRLVAGMEVIQAATYRSIEEAADEAVDWHLLTGAPMFWDGRPYLAASIPEGATE